MNRVILSLPISQFAIVIVCTTIRKGSRLSKPRACGNFSASPTWSTRPMKRCRARSTSLSLQEPLLATDKRWKLVWFGHVTYDNSLSKTILQGTFEGERRRGRQRTCWINKIKEWTSLQARARTAHDGLPQKKTGRRRISIESFLVSTR